MSIRRPNRALLAAALLAGLCVRAGAAAPLVGVVDERLVMPYEWAKPDASAWSTAAYVAPYERLGCRVRVLGAEDLTPAGLAGIQVLAIPGDHVYPERGRWGGPVLQAIAAWVKAGGVYVMPIGVSHWVARDIATGARDAGHFGPDALGLTFTQSSGAPPLSLTAQGRAIGLPEPRLVGAAPARALRLDGPAAVLAWDAGYVPAAVAVPVGRGWVLNSGCGEAMSPSYADWWTRTSARAALAAAAGKLRAMTLAQTLTREGLGGLSLDDLDRRAFRPGPSPMAGPATAVRLTPAGDARAGARRRARPGIERSGGGGVSLDGDWEMVGAEPGKASERAMLAGRSWPGAVRARVPGSVHTALLAAGRIPDPTVGLNADVAREQSYREWWFRREFARPDGLRGGRLVFDGVDYSCTVWLNGRRLGRHEGAFGGPELEVAGLLRERNTLVVRLDPAPRDWQIVLKTNVVYGWHYVNLPSLGIWRSVRLEGEPPVEVEHPFVAARDARSGVVDIWARLRGERARWAGTLEGEVSPENFTGHAWRFRLPVRASSGSRELHLRVKVPEPHLWWPVDLGAPNLYRLHLTFRPRRGEPSAVTTTFGIRTVETRPLPGGPNAATYRWTFVVNGRPLFLKGANWCILDALLRLDRARYARFLTLARDQHTQLLRAWGGGLVETDDFYDLCDRLGILVYQEFPLTWQRSEAISPSVADEIATRSVRRLRSHPSLLMWGGGNEHSGRGPLVEQLGRICLELDGTRPFHRTDPHGGSLHNYDVYWGGQPLDRNLSLTAPFIGEFGLSSPPVIESILRYLPESERSVWPPPESGSFVRHTPTFSAQHTDIMNRYAGEWADTATMAGLVTGMQLAQATGIRHTLERARARWPEATGACYYKLTDVYPACAWATVDWYGVPKIAYYLIQDAYAPIHAVALFESLTAPAGKPLGLPVVLLDDAGALSGPWEVVARAYDSALREVASSRWSGSGAPGRVRRLGELVVPAERASSAPLLIVSEVRRGGRVVDRTFYTMNHAARPGGLFDLPRTRLSLRAAGDRLLVRNEGNVPAVGVHFVCPAISDRFSAEDGYFWLAADESRSLRVSHTRGVRAAAWNAP
ncbi:MAG: beta-mannosidase [Chthonomonadales bacterium]|nr:beta-mannosidase [Chthonomonadales bacterium]